MRPGLWLATYSSGLSCPAGITVSNNTGTSGSFTVPVSAAGTTIPCSVTNPRLPSFPTRRSSDLPTSDPGVFKLTVNSTAADNQTNNGSASATVNVGDTASLSELAGSSMPAGLSLANYSSGLSCPAGMTVSNNTGTSAAFTVPVSAAGTTITCTVTNTHLTATVQLATSLSPPRAPPTRRSSDLSTAADNQTNNGSASATVNVGDTASLSELAGSSMPAGLSLANYSS